MLAQLDYRFSDRTKAISSCFRKDKSWHAVMDFSDETGRNINRSDEIEQSQQQQTNPLLLHRQISSNTAGSHSTGFPRNLQYTTHYETIQSTPDGGSFSQSTSSNVFPTTQFNSDPFAGVDPSSLQVVASQMSAAAGVLSHAATATSHVYLDQHQNSQQPLQVYQYPGSYPSSLVAGSTISPHYTSQRYSNEQQSNTYYFDTQQEQQQMYIHQQLINPNSMNPNTSIHLQTTEMRGTRPPVERPIVKLSKGLIDTYKNINLIYEAEQENRRRARAERRSDRQIPTGVRNNGYDDENYDYILAPNEIINDRYRVQEKLGKGSFGQVVRAVDIVNNTDVAIKIIKSKKPFQVQARTEIEILTHLKNRDPNDEHNIVRLLTHFMYRNHQCLVFEMLSFNLYELLKNTQFIGVSLHLIRKFAKQILKSLQFLARSDVDVIHCDLKPENILLRHPKRSGVKVIDFGSSCRSNRRMYPYIQSRFYRSPEVLLGLPYTVAIDMWSLGCILFEMHTGEPLFSGSDQFDQMQKIVKILGMVPDKMLDRVDDEHRAQFFERSDHNNCWIIKQKEDQSTIVTPSTNPRASLMSVLEIKISANKQAIQSYEMFVDLIYKMLAYSPEERISPQECLLHPFITTELGYRQHSQS